MKKLFIILFLLTLIPLFGCDNENEEITYVNNPSIDNHSFETGDLSGWKGKIGIFTVEEDLTKRYNSDGRYFIKGSKEEKGTIETKEFILEDTGYVSFLIGAGQGECYIEFYVDGTLTKTVNNLYFNNKKDDIMRRMLIDLTDYIGHKIQIKIVDNESEAEFGYLCVDSFDVSVNEADYATYKKVSLEG